MSLLHSFEKSGATLFRYRGQIPVVLFLAAIPVIYFTDYSKMDDQVEWIMKAVAVLICILGFVIRMITIGTAAPFTSGRNTDKQVAASLNTKGIYSIVRHPLYLGNYLMWAGLTLYVLHLWFFLAVSLFFWIYYERIMFMEERFLEKKFGQEFVQWSLKVPAFIPSFRKYQKGPHSFSIRRVLSKEYSGFLTMVISFLFIQTLQDFFEQERFVINQAVILILCISITIVLILKILSRTVWKTYRLE